MKDALMKYLPDLSRKDFFFAVELFGTALRGTLVSVDRETKVVQVRQVAERSILAKPAAAFLDEIPALVRSFRLPATVQVIVLLDQGRATILTDTVTLMRSDERAEVTQAELENLIARALWKLVAVQRRAAAQKMEIPEVRVRLADADIVQTKLDRHRVVNPVGFSAKSIEFSCRATFVDADLLRGLEQTLTDDNIVAIVEAPAVLAGLVSRLHPLSEFLVISVGATDTVVYSVDHLNSRYVDSFGWGSSTLLAGVGRQFALDSAGALRLIEQYTKQVVSPAMRKAIEAAISGELAILTNGIAAHQPHHRVVPVYVHASVPLPKLFFDQGFAGKLGLDLSLTAVNDQFIGAHTGFVVQSIQSGREHAYTFDALLGTLADLYATSSAPGLSKTAKQRARWIRAGQPLP